MSKIKKIAKFLAILTLGIAIGYFIAWYPVIDRVINWCEYYPQSLADCQE